MSSYQYFSSGCIYMLFGFHIRVTKDAFEAQIYALLCEVADIAHFPHEETGLPATIIKADRLAV